VTVGICTAKGSGPNKKLAKKAAAEALLQELGYSQKPPGKIGCFVRQLICFALIKPFEYKNITKQSRRLPKACL
jgi:hypothetical protein